MADQTDELRFPLEQELSSEDDFMAELKKIIFHTGDLPTAEQYAERSRVVTEVSLEEDAARLGALRDEAPDRQCEPADPVASLEWSPQPEAGPQLDEIISSIDDDLEGVPVAADFAVEEVDLRPEQAVEQNLVFTVGGTKYAVATTNVVEIGRLISLTAVPNAPTWLLGVTNRRGDILSVVDLREFLGIGTASSESTRMLVVRTQNDEMNAGLIVDQVNGMLNVTMEEIQSPTVPIETSIAPYLRGLCEHKNDLVAVLNLETLLLSSEMRQFEAV